MAKRLALIFLTLAPFAVLGLFLWTPEGSSALLAVLVMSFPVALVVLATARDGALGRLAGPLAVLFVMLQAGALGVLWSHESMSPGLFGLPPSLGLLLGLVWLGPLLVTTISYAVFFAELGIDDTLLAQLDALRRNQKT